MAVIEYKEEQLSIDASLLPGFQFQTGSLYEFIGEVQASTLEACGGVGDGEDRRPLLSTGYLITRWGPQSRFGDKTLGNRVVCPQKKGLQY